MTQGLTPQSNDMTALIKEAITKTVSNTLSQKVKDDGKLVIKGIYIDERKYRWSNDTDRTGSNTIIILYGNGTLLKSNNMASNTTA